MSINKIRIWGAHSSVFEEGGVNNNMAEVWGAFPSLEHIALPLRTPWLWDCASVIAECSAEGRQGAKRALEGNPFEGFAFQECPAGRQTLITFRPFPFAGRKATRKGEITPFIVGKG